MAALTATATVTTTAATATQIPLWLPEDDLSLKNAIEAGASLEALARGAVRFSRKFSTRELRDRWHSLLYDNEVSAEASSRMVELELSNISSKVNNSNNGSTSSSSKLGGGTKESDDFVKRKFERVRELYYAMRKKMRKKQLGDCDDFGFLGLPGGSGDFVGFDGGNYVGEDNGAYFGFDRKKCYDELRVEVPPFDQVSETKDVPVAVGDGSGEFEDAKANEVVAPRAVLGSSPLFLVEGIESPLPRVPLWKTMEDVSMPEMPDSAYVDDKGHGREEMLAVPDDGDRNKLSVEGENINHPEVAVQDEPAVDMLHRSTAISECDFPDISDSLLNFPNEESLLMDVDGKDALDKSCYDSVPSFLVNSPNNSQDNVPGVKEPRTLTSDTSVRVPRGACLAELKVIPEESHSVGGEHCSNFVSETNAQTSISTPNVVSAEENVGETECMLNTEDHEIPCNDDVFPAKSIASSVMEKACNKTHHLPSSCTNQKDSKQQLILLKKEENPTQSLTSPRMAGQVMLPLTSPIPQLVRSGVKCEPPAVLSGPVIDAHADPCQCRATLGTPSSTVALLKSELVHAKSGFPFKAISVPEADPSTLNQEESGSDDDVPYFSDIEAMILEMDLCPDDSDLFINTEVSRYQNDDGKRAIVRLEQCARSSMQRAIAFRGALAILYGRHLKHYIKKTEVILGRATDDMDVDIDLGREGPANKISRRQALIKMEADGSFILKNIGKSPIFLNGKELATGQSMGLSSSSLIEIREMAFVFEVNSKSVKQYLSTATKSHQKNNSKFEW